MFSFCSRHWKNKVNYGCFGCFEEVTKEYNAKSCANRRICKVCNGKHPATLHIYVRKKKQNDNQKNDSADEVDVKCATVNTGGNVVSMCMVPVNLTYGCSGKTVKTHALLDSCSQGTFMLEKLLQDLGVNGQKTSITIKTVNDEVNNKTTLVEGLKVSSSKDEDGEWIELPKTFTKKHQKKKISQQDMKFMEILDEGTKLKDGHYQIPLPFKQEDVRLPCNKYQAAQRLSYLKRKFYKNEKLKADYIRFMEEIIVKGYARKSTMTTTSGKTWYLPHHGVYHPNNQAR